MESWSSKYCIEIYLFSILTFTGWIQEQKTKPKPVWVGWASQHGWVMHGKKDKIIEESQLEDPGILSFSRSQQSTKHLQWKRKQEQCSGSWSLQDQSKRRCLPFRVRGAVMKTSSFSSWASPAPEQLTGFHWTEGHPCLLRLTEVVCDQRLCESLRSCLHIRQKIQPPLAS